MNNNTNNNLPKMRTIPKAYEELRKHDPNTSMSIRALRLFIRDNVPTIQVGNKILINLDILFSMLYNANSVVSASFSN